MSKKKSFLPVRIDGSPRRSKACALQPCPLLALVSCSFRRKAEPKGSSHSYREAPITCISTDALQ